MAANLCRFISLFIPGLATACLLGYCIFTDNWMRIRPEKVEQFRNESEPLFKDYKDNIANTTDKPIDYLYIEKLWPLIKHKGLYSQCIRYEKFYLKVSSKFITNARKSLITAGKIHYPNYVYQSLEESKPCEGSDKIRCHFTKECVVGKTCDGRIDCVDQTDEQLCTEAQCVEYGAGVQFYCDGKCWNSSQVCQTSNPICTERNHEQILCDKKTGLSHLRKAQFGSDDENSDSWPLLRIFKDSYLPKKDCYEEYFDFKSAKLVPENELAVIPTQDMADIIQNDLNTEFTFHIIYVLGFLSAFVFSLLSLITLFFLICFRKLCLQCPYWFYGLFSILCLLSAITGLTAFVYSYLQKTQRLGDPMRQTPLNAELLRLNPMLNEMQFYCSSFGAACLATLCAFISAICSFVVCCRLPSPRHNRQEYQIVNYNSKSTY